MLLWVIMAVLAAAASLAVLIPLARGRATTAHGAAEVSIYRDQLAEIDRDIARGLIGESEAGAARTEIARRLIKADDDVNEAKSISPTRWRVAAGAAIVAIPAIALGFYVWLGSPDLPDQPLAARLSAPPDQQDIATLVARVESHLANAPDDGQGWQVIAPVYLRLGRYDDAVRAYSNTIRLLGETAQRDGDLGEALMGANGGAVSDDARTAFERANGLDPMDVRPRFYLALGLTQSGRKDEAVAAWQALLKGAPADAGWVPVAERALASLQAAPSMPAAPAAAAAPAVADNTQPGPTAADVQNAQAMSPEQRSAMIAGMVQQLATRLDGQPDDAEGWARLVRSYMVLGRTGDAKAALDKAHAALAGKADKLALVDQAAHDTGLVQ